MDELVLIVEDDPSLSEVIGLGLKGEGFRVVAVSNGNDALVTFDLHHPDLVLLDIMLPGMDGFTVCRELRKQSLVPIIMLTARSSTVDVVVGLESGADDYVTKPFEFPELIARVRSVLRRSSVRVPETSSVAGPSPLRMTTGSSPAPPGTGPAPHASYLTVPPSLAVMTLGSLRIDPGAFKVYRDGEEIPLTVTEFRLLYELVRHAGQVLTRDQLLELVWGYTFLGDSRLVDVHIQRLRAKIETNPAHPQLIATVRGVGYRAEREMA